MTRNRFAALSAALIITLSTPAFAQMGSTAAPTGAGKMGPDTTGAMNSSSMNSGSSMSSGSAMNSDSAMGMNCQSMMNKAHPMMDNMADGRKKTMAVKQMDMANTAMSSGNEQTCMRHMENGHDRHELSAVNVWICLSANPIFPPVGSGRLGAPSAMADGVLGTYQQTYR